MLKTYRWSVVLVLFFMAMLINYLDRSALSVAAPILIKEFNLSPSEMGMVFSSFFIGYATFNLVGGYFSDKYGGRIVLATAMVVWSLFCGLTTMASGLTSLLIIRFMFGVGEGPITAATNKVIFNWFPATERTRAVSYALAGVPLGGAVAGPIVGLMTSYWGWKLAFWILVGVGLIWTVLFLNKVTEHPKDSKHISKEELEEIERGSAVVSAVVADANLTEDTPSIGYYLKKPIILAAGFGYFAVSYVLFFFLSWLPSYLMMAKGLSMKEMSFATIVPWVVGTFGFVFGGHIADIVLKKTGNPYLTRKLITVVSCLVVAVCVVLAGLVETLGSALALTGVALFAVYVATPNFWGIIQDNVSGKRMGLVGGFIHFIANCSGVLAPFITGLIIEKTGGQFLSAFYISAGVSIAGAIVLFMFVKPPKNA